MKVIPIVSYTIGEIQSNSLSIKNENEESETRRLLVADLPAFGAIGLSDKPALILGQDLLKNSCSNVVPTKLADSAVSTTVVAQKPQEAHLVLDLSNNFVYIPR